jgi:phosphomevalonate kinase
LRTDAPGKLVVSGAYAVLRGAPAIVTAVDRRVFADSERVADFRSREVEEGIRLLAEKGPVGDHPWVDPGALRGKKEKLGLGSSGAICVAALAALLVDQKRAQGERFSLDDLAEQLFPLARRAHYLAQGGGSGVDVAASCFGGTLIVTVPADPPDALPSVEPALLPRGLCFEVWGFPGSASTSDFVKEVFALEQRDRRSFDALFTTLRAASDQAVVATRRGDPNDFVAALRMQSLTLEQLGKLAKVPIVLPEVSTLAGFVDQDSSFLPSGAGGGDINLYVGPMPSNETFRQKAEQMGLFSVALSTGAEGVTWPA